MMTTATGCDLGSDGANSAEKVVVAFEEGDDQQTETGEQQSDLCCSKVLISSPTSPPGSCSGALMSMKQGNGNGNGSGQHSNQQLLRDLRLEQLR